MITLENNIEPDARRPTKTIHKNRPVVQHEIVMNCVAQTFRLIHGVSPELSLATTPDGMDAVMWCSLPTTVGCSFRMPRNLDGWNYTVAVVHSNSRRQKTAFYGGMSSYQGVLVFDKLPLKMKREHTYERMMEETVARWSLFIDQYLRRYRELRDLELNRAKYDRLLIESARDGFLAWSRLGKFDHERNDNETALSFLLRFSKHVGRQPPISHEPARSQPWSLHSAYRKIFES